MALLGASRKLFSKQLFSVPFQAKTLAFHTLRKNSCEVLLQRAPLKIKIHQRNYFWIFKRRTKKELILKDNPPDSYELVYRCGYDNYIRSFQFVSCICATLLAVSVIYRSGDYNEDPTRMFASVDDNIVPRELSLDDNDLLILMSGFAFLLIITQLFVARVPLTIYYNYNRSKYLIYCNDVIPNRTKILEVKAGEIEHVSKENSFLPWTHETYTHSPTGQKLILHQNYFRTPMDLSIMMGSVKDPNSEYAQSDSKSSPYKPKDE